MKRLYIITLILAIFSLNTSCDNDGGDSVIPTKKDGALPDFKKVAGSIDFIDVMDLNSVDLQFTVGIGIGDAASFDLKAYYKTVDDKLYGPVTLDENVGTFPKQYSLSSADLFNAFSELNDADDIQAGDMLKLFTTIVLKDGTQITTLTSKGEANYSLDFEQFQAFNVKMEYPVSCSSNIKTGVYTVVSNGTSTEPGIPPAVDYSYDVTLTADGGGNYTISDGVAGVYIYWYSGFGYTFETKGKFSDICGNLSGSWVDGFSSTIVLTGTLNDDGTLSISWTNDFGDITNAVYTPK